MPTLPLRKRLLRVAHKHARMLRRIRRQADEDEAVGPFVDESDGSEDADGLEEDMSTISTVSSISSISSISSLSDTASLSSQMDLDEDEETSGMLGTELGIEFTDELYSTSSDCTILPDRMTSFVNGLCLALTAKPTTLISNSSHHALKPWEDQFKIHFRSIFHGRNILISRNWPHSRTSPPTIVAVIDWDFGGSQALQMFSRSSLIQKIPQMDKGRKFGKCEFVGRLPVDYGSAQMRCAPVQHVRSNIPPFDTNATHVAVAVMDVFSSSATIDGNIVLLFGNGVVRLTIHEGASSPIAYSPSKPFESPQQCLFNATRKIGDV
ncbi:hypothetical protein JB92DRAFT_3096891 [Gautieria morchelliformis]|nr:hypothetical protein JB92DRAFT_3096891 [Gautieria morchelliformis]